MTPGDPASGVQANMQAMLAMMRPSYWLKNMLVFVPAFFAGTLHQPVVFKACLVAFLLLSLTASATYIFNDLMDRDSDGKDAGKQHRPLPSGQMSVESAIALMLALFLGALTAAFLWGTTLGLLLIAYVAGSLVYTVAIKKLVIVDAAWLSAMHTGRLVIGGEVAAVQLSIWLTSFALLFFLSLALAKRYSELQAARDQAGGVIAGRAYAERHKRLVYRAGAVSGSTSILVLLLYALDEYSAQTYAHPQLLWLAVAIVIAWSLRIWTQAAKGLLLPEPLSFALRDAQSLAMFAGLVIVLSIAR